NNSAPLKIHIIFLTTKEKFMSANFFNLQNNIKNILGDKLIYEEQFFITPDKYHYNLSEKNQPKANYIGVIAEYMQLDDKYWRISFPIPTPEHIPFYKFWRSKPDALQVCIKVTGNGLNPDLNCAEGAE
ncbi:MAG: type VI secretion system lipoprotein TssJ, partial [Enterobacteriaceae bacterium]|nr:type VI secretion system lipoprotein TssJ [Enterobacteriaceae bacterium]